MIMADVVIGHYGTGGDNNMANTPRNQIVQRPQGAVADFDDRGKKFTTFINGTAIKNLLTQSLGGPQAAAQVTSTLISQVSQNEKLQKCQPMTILAAALRGEVGMGLSLVLGDYAIIPYNDQASFQLQVNGLKRLALNSKAYAKIDVFDVRDGEFKGRDPVTRDPIIQWIEDEDEREQLAIVGYYAFYKLNEQYNGFTSTLYWSYDKILKHARRYSKAVNWEKFDLLRQGKISPKEAEWLRRGSPWYGDPTEESHMKMCKKTMIKQLLGDGFAPKSTTLQTALAADNAEERGDEPVVYADTFDAMAREAALADARVQPQIEAGNGGQIVRATEPEEAPAQDTPKKRGRPGKAETASGNFSAPAGGENTASQSGQARLVPTDAEPMAFDEDPFDEDPFA